MVELFDRDILHKQLSHSLQIGWASCFVPELREAGRKRTSSSCERCVKGRVSPNFSLVQLKMTVKNTMPMIPNVCKISAGVCMWVYERQRFKSDTKKSLYNVFLFYILSSICKDPNFSQRSSRGRQDQGVNNDGTSFSQMLHYETLFIETSEPVSHKQV